MMARIAMAICITGLIVGFWIAGPDLRWLISCELLNGNHVDCPV